MTIDTAELEQHVAELERRLELLQRIVDVERRLRELEQVPVYPYPVYPVYPWPSTPAPWLPTITSPGTSDWTDAPIVNVGSKFVISGQGGPQAA